MSARRIFCCSYFSPCSIPSEFVTHMRGWLWYGISSKGEEYQTENDRNTMTWVGVKDIDKLDVEFIGVSNSDIKPGVILASFNAG